MVDSLDSNETLQDTEYVECAEPQKLRLDAYFRPGGGGVHNMLRVRVCAAHMGGFLGPKFSKQGSLFPKLAKIAKNGWFSA